MDNENSGEQAPTKAEVARAPRPLALEAVDTPDGRQVVAAEGSVWQFYFPGGRTPTEDQMKVAAGALGAVKTMQAGNLAHTGWDASADGETTDITDFTGQSIIDPVVRADAVENARRAEAFNERVESEVNRIVGEQALVLEERAEEQIDSYRQIAREAEGRAVAAEGARSSIVAEMSELRQETDVLREAIRVAKVDSEIVDGIRREAAQKSVLPPEDDASIVEDVGERLTPSVEPTTDHVQGKERKA